MCVCVLPTETQTVPSCDKDQFLCANKKCISSTLRCNFFNDCEDYGSDEIDCKTGQLSFALCDLTLALALAVSANIRPCLLLSLSPQTPSWTTAGATGLSVGTATRRTASPTPPTPSVPASWASRRPDTAPAEVRLTLTGPCFRFYSGSRVQ